MRKQFDKSFVSKQQAQQQIWKWRFENKPVKR